MRARVHLSQHRRSVLESRARGMRHQLTSSEEVLWQALRGRKLGVEFRRQVVLCGRYIADFFAAEVGLVVEVDGASHAARGRADARRDRALEAAGYRVVRLEARLVVEAPGFAAARVREAVAVARRG